MVQGNRPNETPAWRSLGRGSLGAIALLGCLLLPFGLASAGQARDPEPQGPRFAGMALADALADLRSRGLRIVFTSEIVGPDLRVEAEPRAKDLRRILDELLEPHGLEAREGPLGTLVVVRRPAAEIPDHEASIAGSIRSRPDSAAVAGAFVRVVETGVEVVSSADGTFLIPRHDAGAFTLEVGRAGFVVQRVEGVTLTDGRRTEVAILLDPAPAVEEALVITPSLISLVREEPRGTLGLSREEILALPHLGDDLFRAVSLFPGVAANDVSAQFNVRGARRDETQILLDGQELYEAYHLKDFDSALSFVASSTLRRTDLSTGGFSAQFGDRMSGVLDMTTVAPSGPAHGRIGVSVLSLQAGGGGGFHDGRGTWLAEVRRGTIDLAKSLLGDEHPQYGDAYAKLEYQLDGRNSLDLHLLYSNDDFEFDEITADESKRTDTEYRSAYSWITHRMLLTRRMFVETAVSLAGIARDRRGKEVEADVQFDIRDERDSHVLGLRQDWTLEASSRHLFKYGLELRGFDAGYDYFGSHTFANPLAAIRDEPSDGTTVFRGEFDAQHGSAYVSDRVRLADAVTLELGLRHDRHTLTDESDLSPRLNLAWFAGRASVLRLAWGGFQQSQRPYELQVEDGETQFHPTERATHRVLGFEKVFFPGGQPGRGLTLRAEVYRREVENPRPRYENLYEALNTFPEVEPDRVRIAPERSVAEGVELFLQGRVSERLGWWANYAYASTEDEIDGARAPRSIDQTNTLNASLDYRAGRHWRLSLAFRYHTGWPTTPLSLEEEIDDAGQTVFVPVLGPLNSERVSDYHRMDLRASREFEVRGDRLVFFADIQNIYNRKNVAGFDFEIDDEAGTITAEEEYWAGILPSVGITYEF